MKFVRKPLFTFLILFFFLNLKSQEVLYGVSGPSSCDVTQYSCLGSLFNQSVPIYFHVGKSKVTLNSFQMYMSLAPYGNPGPSSINYSLCDSITGSVIATFTTSNSGSLNTNQLNQQLTFSTAAPAALKANTTYYLQLNIQNYALNIPGYIIGGGENDITNYNIQFTEAFQGCITMNNWVTNSIGQAYQFWTVITLNGEVCQGNNTLSIASSAQSVCNGQTITLTASGATSYTWSGGATTPSIVVTPTVSQKYTVLTNYEASCYKVKSIYITVNPLPSIIASAVPNPIISGQTTATLTASGANTYTWTYPNSQPNTTGASITVNQTVSTQYQVTGTNTLTQCQGTANIFVPSCPTTPPLINIEQIAAPDKGITLRANVISQEDNYTLSWSDSLPNNTNSYKRGRYSILTINTSSDTIYWVEINYGAGCPVYKSKQIYITTPDGDGNIYPAVKIGKQYWMINNLRSTTFNDGTRINGFVDPITNLGAAQSWYNNDSIGNALRFGALYNQSVILNDNGKNACPVNWKPAGYSDWKILSESKTVTNISGDLKSWNTWNNWYPMTTNLDTYNFNFNANASGTLENSGNYWNQENYDYEGAGQWATWWAIVYTMGPDITSTSKTTDFSRVIKLNSPDNSGLTFPVPGKQNSIRCVGGY